MNDWIAIEKELPPPGQVVLFASVAGVNEGYHWPGRGWFLAFVSPNEGYPIYGVTHWMTKPPGPAPATLKN